MSEWQVPVKAIVKRLGRPHVGADVDEVVPPWVARIDYRVEHQVELRSMRFAQAAKEGDCIFDGRNDSKPFTKRTKGVS